METGKIKGQVGKKTNYRFIALLMILLVLAFSTGDRAALSVAAGGMQKSLHLTKVDIGIVMSAFSWTYCIMQLPGGWLGDKIGSKKVMAIAISLWSVVTFILGFSGWLFFSLGVLILLRVLLGVFESPVGPASGRILAGWFPTKERGIAGAIYNSAQYLSIAVFTPFMGWIAYKFGWEYVYIDMGVLGIVIVALWLKLFYIPRRHPKVNQAEIDYIKEGGGLVDFDYDSGVSESGKIEKKTFKLRDIGTLFKSRTIVGVFIAQYCVCAITYFYLTWFPTYLVEARGFSILKAGIIASLPAICGCIGGVSSGFVSDGIFRKTNNLSIARKIPITIGLLLSTSIIACNYTNSNVIVIFLMSLAFFGKGFGNLAWTVIGDIAPKRILGVTGGLINGIGNFAGVVTPIVIGIIVTKSGSFNGGLLYIGLHGVVAILSYWLIVGKIKRVEID